LGSLELAGVDSRGLTGEDLRRSMGVRVEGKQSKEEIKFLAVGNFDEV